MLSVLRVYYRFLWRYPWLMAGFVGAVVLAGVFQNIQSYFYKLFVDTLGTGSQVGLVQLILIYTMVRILKTMVDNLTYFLGDKVVLPASRDARMAVFKRIQDLDFAYHQSRSTGSLISAIKRGDNAFF